ncbi:MAG: DUF1257 domain-containing protein [Candidatus Omnitrophica bacterium]|nr:DUF1257 domain-containing protein [Candidatus Omnitrophota bacterium]
MSSGGGIQLVIYSIQELIKAIEDLQLARQEKTRIETETGRIEQVDVVVQDTNGKQVGFQKQKDGSYKVIADSRGLTAEQLKKQKEFINSIKRKYAYNMVTQQLQRQGYQIVEEKKVEKQAVKLVARRWIG